MVLSEILHMMRPADKVQVFEGGQTLYIGDVNKCMFRKELRCREVQRFHPELLGGLHIYLKIRGKT